MYEYTPPDGDSIILDFRHIPNTKGLGYLSGNFPLNLINESTNPDYAVVRAVVSGGDPLVHTITAGTTTVLPNGHWVIDNLNKDLVYDVIAEIPGYNGIIISNVSPDPDYVPPKPVGDPYWDYVVSLLRFNRADYLKDESSGVQWGLSANSSSSPIPIPDGPFGAAIRFDGSPRSIEEKTKSTSHQITDASPFTIEMWVRLSADSTGSRTVLSKGKDGNTLQFWMTLNNTSVSWVQSRNGSGGSTQSYIIGFDFQFDTWHHLAIVGKGNQKQFFINGVGQQPFTFTAQLGAWAVNDPIRLGSLDYGASYFYWFIGDVSELRITNHLARYTENFTPPTEPFPNHGIL